ncbi:hypothetical protein BDN70DRAFT_926234 [Pholiota conissans]|uniref:Uncharacterized protein n=1 Tax=Pholiota conissans TaxID=109636 RepID=A0A9P6CSM1_9AGAR|nr:hypothetical protein BDN70DRAFT_926234 [Pholiota conissans]
MKQGFRVWDAHEDVVFDDHPFGHLGTADGPGMTHLNGLTGHSGAYGCRIYCAVKGRRKTGGNHYYPALLKPVGYNEYLDALNKVLSLRTHGQHQENRRQTGITKPSIFSRFPHNRTIGVPACFVGDLMHLVALNLTDLLVNLWRGNLDCDPEDNKSTWDWDCLTGDVWIEHGQHVADTMPYLPGSFDRPPRNPADKINSRYLSAVCYTQWTMERTIGNLGEEIKQHSKVNAMMPDLERKCGLPRPSPSNTAPSPTPSTGCTTCAQAVTKERAAPVPESQESTPHHPIAAAEVRCRAPTNVQDEHEDQSPAVAMSISQAVASSSVNTNMSKTVPVPATASNKPTPIVNPLDTLFGPPSAPSTRCDALAADKVSIPPREHRYMLYASLRT